MKRHSFWHVTAIIVSSLALLAITYSTLIVNNFRTPEATANFLKNSNSYYYIAEIVKANIRSHYPTELRTNVLQLTVADTILNTIVNQNLVERLALPTLRITAKVEQLPLSFAQKNLVLNTGQYTQKLNATLTSLNLPTAVTDAGQKLIASVPQQITVVDTEKNPQSVLAAVVRARILLDNIQTILTVSWVILGIALLTLLLVNIRYLKRLVKGIIWIFATCGILVLIASHAAPAIAGTFPPNPDPIAGVLKDQMINSILTYYFSLTRSAGVAYFITAIVFFLVHHFVPFQRVQVWVDSHIFPTQKATKHR